MNEPLTSFGIPSDVLAWQATFFTVLSIAVGIPGGAVGLALGTIRLPALIAILNINPHIAVGSNLVIGFLIGGFGWVGHLTRGQVDFPILTLMAITGDGRDLLRDTMDRQDECSGPAVSHGHSTRRRGSSTDP